jgi:ribosomal protein S18 acetylase RimI-like enzyme
MKRLADAYESHPDIHAFSYFGSNCVTGVIVLKHCAALEFEIVRIAVHPAFRKQGIGSKLISFAIHSLGS